MKNSLKPSFTINKIQKIKADSIKLLDKKNHELIDQLEILKERHPKIHLRLNKHKEEISLTLNNMISHMINSLTKTINNFYTLNVTKLNIIKQIYFINN